MTPQHPTTHTAFVAAGAGQAFDAAFTPLVEVLLEETGIPGLAVGVVAEGKMAYARGFGVRRQGESTPITPATLFHMASLSKPFVATVIMQLVEEGKVSLKDPLSRHLPYFRLDDSRVGEVTIERILSHASGMPDVDDYEWDKPQYDEGALERYVRSLPTQKLLCDPGTMFAYSNMAYECLGDVIAKVTGMPFEEAVATRILAPLGMSSSSFLMTTPLAEAWAVPHLGGIAMAPWDGYPYNRAHGPSSTLHSNVVDMCRWALANLQGGALDETRILPEKAHAAMQTPRMAVGGNGLSIGVSWFLSEPEGEKHVSHSGGDTGFETYFSFLPERGLGVVVLSHTSPTPTVSIAKAALATLRGAPPAAIPVPDDLKVCHTYGTRGLEAALAQARTLLAEKPHLREAHFLGHVFYNAIQRSEPTEALQLAALCQRLYSAPALKEAIEELKALSTPAAQAALRLLECTER